MYILQQHRQHNTFSHWLQKQLTLLEKLGQMVAINDWFKYKGWIIYTWINSFWISWKKWWCHCLQLLYIICKTIHIFRKIKENKSQNTLNIDFMGYLSKLKYILKIEKSICIHNNQSIKFNKFNFIYDNL